MDTVDYKSGCTKKDTERFFQIVILGDWGTGKSTIYTRFRDGAFKPDIDDRGFDKTEKIFTRMNKTVKVQLWDTAGLERAGDMTSGYFRYADAVLLTYDLTDIESLTSLRQRWIDNCLQYCQSQALYFVVGTKLDLKRSQQIDDDRLKYQFEDCKIHIDRFFKISTKTGENFDAFIESMVDCWLDKSVAQAPQRQRTIPLAHQFEEPKKGCC